MEPSLEIKCAILVAFTTNNRLSWRVQTGANTLAYLSRVLLMKKNCVIALTPMLLHFFSSLQMLGQKPFKSNLIFAVQVRSVP